MSDLANAVAVPAVRPLRIWPVVALSALYWAFIFAVSRLDMPMFQRFVSKTLAGIAFLLVFIVLWLSTGRLTWKLRLGMGLPSPPVKGGQL